MRSTGASVSLNLQSCGISVPEVSSQRWMRLRPLVPFAAPLTTGTGVRGTVTIHSALAIGTDARTVAPQRVQVKAAAGLPPVTVWVVRLAC